MKRILYSICAGTMAFAMTAFGAQNDPHRGHGKHAERHAAPAAANRVVRHHAVRQHAISSARHVTRSRYVSTARALNRVARSRVATHRQHIRSSIVSRNRANTANRRAYSYVAAKRAEQNNRARNEAIHHRHRNGPIVNNWRGDRFRGSRYAAFRNYHRERHHRDWWRHHYTRIVFVMGGWWYWNAGYWYPALGYAPYAYYPYEGPIYTGYADLQPDQVIVQVQEQLQRDGYDPGPIDGVLGPTTRSAIAAYQADHGLAVTSTVDEPTLDTLGVT